MDLGALLVHLLHDVSLTKNNILVLELGLLEVNYPNEDLGWKSIKPSLPNQPTAAL